MARLIITNGDTAADIIGAAGLAGRILPWRDVLHEGPLAPLPRLEEMSESRARYLSQRFGIPFAEARADFLARDAVVRAHALFDEVEIWLEHDLYDQLQLLQILDFFAGEGRTEGLRLIQAGDFLATQRPDNVLRFAEKAVPVTNDMLAAAAAIWRALRDNAPTSVAAGLDGVPNIFRFLKPALYRFLDELPSAANGLTRTETAILAAVAGGGLTPRDVFRQLLAGEEAAFMGDWSAFRILDDLAAAAEPPVTGLARGYPCQGTQEDVDAYIATPLAVTEFGRSLLAGDSDMVAANGIDRWWAGTHLSGFDCWRWDAGTLRLKAPVGHADRPRSWHQEL